MTNVFRLRACVCCCFSVAVALTASGGVHAFPSQQQLPEGGRDLRDAPPAAHGVAAVAEFALAGYDSPPPLAATALNYYVSPAGVDTASGSPTAPFKTLAHAALVVAGKAAAINAAGTRQGITVWVAPGTYEGGFKTSASGEAAPAARIYYVSTTKWGARIVPPAAGASNSAWSNRGNYVSIVGFEVDGSKRDARTAWRYGLYSGGSHTRFHGNKVHHIANHVPCTSVGGSAIGIDSYYRGVKGEVTDNVVHDIGQAGCRFTQGIYISTSASVKNNIVYRVAAAGIHLWHDANDVVVTNNTVSWSTHGIVVGGGDFYWRTIGADDIRVHRNVLHNNVYGISEVGKTGCDNVYKDNVAYKNKRNWSLKSCVTHTSATNTRQPSARRLRQPGAPDHHARNRGSPSAAPLPPVAVQSAAKMDAGAHTLSTSVTVPPQANKQ
jgi:hypothetical protein